jgi:DNA-binding GntR family transcriptional regulator
MARYRMSVVAELSAHGAAGARIAGELRDAILNGEYDPGARIRQDDLEARYGASRVPVREALRMLESEGLLTVVANTGAWVTELTLADCEELYRIRERIEPLLLAYSAPGLSTVAIDRLSDLAEAMERVDDVEEFLALDREFHLGSYAAADTTVLSDLVLRLWNRTQHYRREYTRVFHSTGDRSAHYDHRLLVGALRRGDTEEAERILAAHIRRTRLELSQHPDTFR